MMKLKIFLLSILVLGSIYGCSLGGGHEYNTIRSTDNGIERGSGWTLKGDRQKGGEGFTSGRSTKQGYEGKNNTGLASISAVDKEGNGTNHSIECDGSPENCSDDGLRSELWYSGGAVLAMGLVWRLSQGNMVRRRRSPNNSNGHS